MAVECFLKFEPELKGESQGDGHEGEIDVLSWSWGASQSGTMQMATGGTGGRADVQDLSLTKIVDAASPNLMLKCLSGKSFEKAILLCRKVGGDGEKVDYIQYTLKNVIISAVTQGGSNAGDLFTESVSLNFAEIEFVYKPQKDDGTADADVTASWSVRQNKAA